MNLIIKQVMFCDVILIDIRQFLFENGTILHYSFVWLNITKM